MLTETHCVTVRDIYCDLSYLPLVEGKEIAVFDTNRKYITENLNPTSKGDFLDERTMKKGNNASK